MDESNQERPHLEDPMLIKDDIDAVMRELANPIEMRSAVDNLIDQQTALYQQHREKRERGEYLTPQDEEALTEISFALKSLQEVYEKYGRTDQ